MSSNENGEEIYIYGTHGNINGSQYQYPLSIVDGSNYNWARGLWKLKLNVNQKGSENTPTQQWPTPPEEVFMHPPPTASQVHLLAVLLSISFQFTLFY